MKDQNTPTTEVNETRDPDFQFILTHLLDAYKPILEQDLKNTKTSEELTELVRKHPQSCQDEIALANEIFGKFFTEEVARRLLPVEGRQLLGPIERWRWCFLHIRCCMIFGWLVCRGQRTFRALAYYLFRHFKCVREAVGVPLGETLTDEQRLDFRTLVNALAEAYKPFLTGQLASVEFPYNVPEEVTSGRIDCLEGQDEAAAVFERLLSVQTAPALLGKEAFQAHSRESFFWFCRCWCLCAIRFGCCLARARSAFDVFRCVLDYFICVRNCFRPLIGEIDTPAENACADTTLVPGCSNLVGIPVTGTATGSAFDHYTLTYRWGGGSFVNDAVVYPNCDRPPVHASSATAVAAGVLGYLDVTLLPPGETSFTIALDVFGSGGLHIQVTRDFQIRTTAVEISAAATVKAFVADDPFNPGNPAKLIKTTNTPPTTPELSIGGAFSVTGSAYTVGCNRIMTQFALAATAVSPLVPVPSFPSIPGGAAALIPSPVVYDDNPSHPWQSGCFPVITPNIILNGDLVAEWAANSCVFLGINYTVPKVEPLPFWDSTPLNGRYTIVLETRDRLLPAGPFPGSIAAVDQVTAWIDNRQPVGVLSSIGGISGCGDLHLKNYAGTTADIIGIAWDPPIDPAAPQMAPNDNFGGYNLAFQKNGGGSGTIPVATPGLRVPNVWPLQPPLPGGTLANWDIVSALDGGAGPVPPGSPKIPRGQRCAYVITLSVWDNTHVGDSGSNHSTGPILYAINVINDLP
ncbi:MAG: hypothetical protein ACR2NN_26390 [Bryobacteraceae bacterium]